MYGVSPAYFFSRYTTEFSVSDYIAGLDLLKRMGFEGYQLEVFHPDRLDEWLTQAPRLARRGNELGMSATQFVAHFLLMATKDEPSLMSDLGYEQMKGVVEVTHLFPECTTITLPIAPFAPAAGTTIEADQYRRLWDRLMLKLLAMARIVESGGLRLALELVPGSLIGSTEGFLRMMHEAGNTSIGYNFDTGHAWSSKEAIALIPAKLAGRIYGTHLKDNFGTENLALPPGDGSIPWPALLSALQAAGYEGSLDLEIACADKEAVEAAYRKGKEHVQRTIAAMTTS